MNYTIEDAIYTLVDYSKEKKLIYSSDESYAINRLLHILKLDEITPRKDHCTDVFEAMEIIYDYSYKNGIIDSLSVGTKDAFLAFIMDSFMSKPSDINRRFWVTYSYSPEAATSYYYDLSKASLYIRTDRIAKNIVYQSMVENHNIDITINLSKPEKDPKDIAAAKNNAKKQYPKCLLCKENVGYYGGAAYPGRSNHRIIQVALNNEEWYMQYSPYSYYNEHCICFNKNHSEMKIDRNCFASLLDFVELFPHYFIGSNADLPIVGGSILSHEHFQGGAHSFAMASAPKKGEFAVEGYADVSCAIVDWPMSVIRLQSANKNSLVNLANHILEKWIDYSDESLDIHAYTDSVRHNTITPIARINENSIFEMDLVLRNNYTSEEYPLGLFHPHSNLWHIKKENIGLIEVMGLAVLPARLETELKEVSKYILENTQEEIASDSIIKKHENWINYLKTKHKNISKSNINDIIKDELAIKFYSCLVDAGVFKQDSTGEKGFWRFINSL